MARFSMNWLGYLVCLASLSCSTAIAIVSTDFVSTLQSQVQLHLRPETCDLETQLCNTLENKVPPVHRAGLLRASPSVEKTLSSSAKDEFEHALGEGLAASQPVKAATAEFASRLLALIVNGSHALNGQSESDALLEAFAGRCSAHNTGYIGPFPDKMRRVLAVEGNIREVWGLVYCLTKNKRKLTTLFQGLPAALLAQLLGAEAGARAAVAVRGRAELVRKTRALQVDAYTWGVPDFIFPPLDSWVRFNFDAQPATNSTPSTLMWRGARQPLAHCSATGRRSDDPALRPPLSAAELEVQCGGLESCELQWWPGKGCFELIDTSLAGELGYVRLAERLGYRTAAGPSATTANVLQLALLLGFSRSDLVLFRATMAAWMLPVDDHSFFEVMLGADALMPPAFRMPVGFGDLAQLWPRNLTLQASWGPSFVSQDVWGPVRQALSAPRGELRGNFLEEVHAALP